VKHEAYGSVYPRRTSRLLHKPLRLRQVGRRRVRAEVLKRVCRRKRGFINSGMSSGGRARNRVRRAHILGERAQEEPVELLRGRAARRTELLLLQPRPETRRARRMSYVFLDEWPLTCGRLRNVPHSSTPSRSEGTVLVHITQ
jgi:hypothetical protein